MSDDFELLVIGGGPAGLASARGFRDAGGRGPVAIVADEGRMPYRRPPLTKELLRGEVDERELPLEDELWLWEQNVSLIAGRAVALRPAHREVALSGGRRLTYRSCVLATGAEPGRLPVPGADDPGVRVVRSLDHVRELLVRLKPGDAVVVIGSGFIGCELAASLRARKHPVTLVSDEAWPNAARVDEEAARRVASWLRADGVTLELGAAVDQIERRDGELHVVAGTRGLRAPVVVMATGVHPRSELLDELADDDGAIPVDASMRSTTEGVLAAGDVAYALNATAGRRLRVEHWGEALAQGAIAGRTAAGRPDAWRAVPGFWSTIGGRTLKYAGWGDGFDETTPLHASADGEGFTVCYGREGRLVAVLAHERDADYERGQKLIEQGAPWPG